MHVVEEKDLDGLVFRESVLLWGKDHVYLS